MHTPAGSSAGTEDAEGAVEAKPTTRNFKLFKKHQQMPSKKVCSPARPPARPPAALPSAVPAALAL